MVKRRLVVTVCTLATLALLWPVHGVAGAEEVDFSAVSPDSWTGEPYELLGNRIFFTSWYFVRPGGFAWIDNEGHNVSANRQAKIGPDGAHYVRRDDMAHGVKLMAEAAQRSLPVLKAERPWEAVGLTLNCVLQEEGRYRAWGRCEDAEGHGFSCYFESEDGTNWTRPELGLVEYEGTTANNLLPVCPQVIFVDPTAPPETRYKGVADGSVSMEEFRAFIAKHPDRWEHRALRKDAGFICALFGYTSSDGLSWQRLDEPFTVEHSDTQQGACYDRQRKKYVLFTRTYDVGPRSGRAPEDPGGMGWLGEARGAGRRAIGRTESDRFEDFPVSRLLLVPRPDMLPTELLYTNCYTTMPGAPDHHLLFPTVWDTSTDATRLEAAASHDGQVWNWLPGGTLMNTGVFGEFDGGCIFWHPNLIELPNGDFVLPYTGYAFPHKYPRGAWSYGTGYAVWPRGRFMALVAEEQGGFSTVSIMPPGRRVRINAVTERAGSIRVAVTRRDGSVLAGRSMEDFVPIVGDHAWSAITWKEGDGLTDDLGLAEGEPICLRFEMDHARIFGLEFAG